MILQCKECGHEIEVVDGESLPECPCCGYVPENSDIKAKKKELAKYAKAELKEKRSQRIQNLKAGFLKFISKLKDLFKTLDISPVKVSAIVIAFGLVIAGVDIINRNEPIVSFVNNVSDVYSLDFNNSLGQSEAPSHNNKTISTIYSVYQNWNTFWNNDKKRSVEHSGAVRNRILENIGEMTINCFTNVYSFIERARANVTDIIDFWSDIIEGL